MLRKIFYFGVGLASLVYDNFDELARIGEERYDQIVHVNHPDEEILEIETDVTVATAAEALDETPDTTSQDDLTTIKGIGPTFANRLQDAGITTFSALAQSTVSQVKEITQVAEWQADPQEWISEAGALA